MIVAREALAVNEQGAAVKKIIPLLMCVLAAGTVAPAGAEELYPQPQSTVQRARGDADAAHRREADLRDQIAAQERANEALRDQLRRADADPAGLQRDL